MTPPANYWQNRMFGHAMPTQKAIDPNLPSDLLYPPRPKVAVLGGGISGLASAYELAKQGMDVTVIEGSPRLGGHIHTHRAATENGFYFEAGAELVDTNHIALRQMLKELGIGLVDSSHSTKGDFFHSGGQVRSDAELLEAYKPLAGKLRELQSWLRTPEGQWTDFARELDSISMDTMLDYYVSKGDAPQWVADMFKQSYSGEIGRDPKELSAVAFLDTVGADVERGLEIFGDSDEASRIANGTDSIIHTLEAKLKEMGVNFRMQEQITGLENAPDGEAMIVHSSRDGATEVDQYDYVVSALPLNALRHVGGIENIGLNRDQLAAINETNYSTIVKFAVETKGKPWLDIRAADGSGGNGTIYTDGTFQTAWVSSEGQPSDNLEDPNANSMVTFFVGGENSKLPVEELIARAKQEYAAIVGKSVSEVFTNSPPIVADWANESRGCYTSTGPGQYTRLESMREQTHPSFSMVGEFVPTPTERGCNIGFMNNGADSAQREAARAVNMMMQREQGQGIGYISASPQILEQITREQALPASIQPIGHHTSRALQQKITRSEQSTGLN